jgi:hypothetical protein
MENNHDDQAAMLTAFRHAANSIGVEAGITKDHVGHGEIAASVCGDAYYLDLIRGAEHRLEQLSVKYERLRAAGAQILQAHYRSEVDCNAMSDMDEVLKGD